jgi:acetyl esterase
LSHSGGSRPSGSSPAPSPSARSRNLLHVVATFGQIVVFWGFFLIVVPLLISFLEQRWGVGVDAPWFVGVVGGVILTLASALGIWAAVTMSTLGKGTPLPAAMPTALVIAGPYRWVRNPMAVAGIVQGAAVGLMLSSWLVVVYALIGSVVWNYAVRPHEEADLEKRFGDGFRRYRDAVRCWIPRRPRVLVAAVLVGAVILTGCTQPEADGALVAPSTTYGGVTVVDDLDYGAPGGVRLDVCMPDDDAAEPRAAIIGVHGGSWSGGDKGQRPWREICAWLASEGFVVFQTNYRLAPANPYPAGIDDVTTAVGWIRDDAQADRFGYDPARLGAFGDSAGANLTALLGTRGEGDTTTGSRVAAVVDLSGPIDLTREGAALGDLAEDFQRVELAYLGCASFDDCPDALDASPLYQVDASDPPFFVAHSVDEFIPVEQAEVFVEALEAVDVDVTYVAVPGTAHALSLLYDQSLRDEIAGWLHDRLGR